MITKTKKYLIISLTAIFLVVGIYLLVRNINPDFSLYNYSYDSEEITPLSPQVQPNVNKENSYTRYLEKYSEKEAKDAHQYFAAANYVISENTILNEDKSYILFRLL